MRISVQGTILMLILSLTPFVMTGYCLKEADVHDYQIFCRYSLQDCCTTRPDAKSIWRQRVPQQLHLL